MPSRWIRGLLAVTAFVAVFVSYGRINGQHAGVALLVVSRRGHDEDSEGSAEAAAGRPRT